MRLNLFIISIFLFVPYSFSQQFTIKGKVSDNQTLAPISGAYVLIDGSFFFTNQEGVYKAVMNKPGPVTLKAGHLGYKSETKTVMKDAGGITEQNFLLTSTLIEMDEIYISSSRKERLLRSSPASEALIAAEQIEVKPFNSLVDAVKAETGVSLMRDGIWGTEVTIRGLTRQNIVAMVDGARIETSTDHSARLSMVDLNSIDRIEIVKGAASSSYGTGATGGVINIVTKSPGFSDDLYLGGGFNYGAGSSNGLNSFAGNLTASGSFWSANLNGSYRKAADTETPRGEIKNSRFTDYSLSASVDITPFTGHLIGFKYQQFRAEDVGIPGGAPLFTNISDVRYPIEKRNLYLVNYQITDFSSLIKRIKFDAASQYILRDVEVIPYIVQNVAKTSTSPARRISVQKLTPGADHNFNTARVAADLVIFEGNILNAGADYWVRRYEGRRERYQKIETLDSLNNTVSTTYKVTGEKPLPNSSFSSLGLFIQDDFSAIKNVLNLSLGGRVDFINIKGDKTYNPEYEITNGVLNASPAGRKLNWDGAESDDVSYSANFGAVYNLQQSISLTLNLGYSFRSPSLEERFQFIDLGSLVRLGNPYLGPEKGLFADIGARYYSSGLKLLSSFFYNHIADYVVEVPSIYEGRQARVKQNVGKARLYGFEISADYNFYENFIAFSSVSFVNGEDIGAGENLPQIPPVNGSFGIGYKNENVISAEISADFSGTQKKAAAGEVSTPGYTIYNCSLSTPSYRFGRSAIKFYTGIENIFDKAYRNHLSTVRGSVTIEPGRSIYFKASLNL